MLHDDDVASDVEPELAMADVPDPELSMDELSDEEEMPEEGNADAADVAGLEEENPLDSGVDDEDRMPPELDEVFRVPPSSSSVPMMDTQPHRGKVTTTERRTPQRMTDEISAG